MWNAEVCGLGYSAQWLLIRRGVFRGTSTVKRVRYGEVPKLVPGYVELPVDRLRYQRPSNDFGAPDDSGNPTTKSERHSGRGVKWLVELHRQITLNDYNLIFAPTSQANGS